LQEPACLSALCALVHERSDRRPQSSFNVDKLSKFQPAPGEPRGDGCHEGMIHSRAGAMRHYVASSCVGWVLQQAGNANGFTYRDANSFGNRMGHATTFWHSTLCCGRPHSAARRRCSYSGLIPANLITSAHFLTFALTNTLNSAGVITRLQGAVSG